MPTNGMTIDSLNTVSSLTAQDEVPVWDKEASGEPTKKITAKNMANSVKSLASLPNTTEMNNAIAQSTAIPRITDVDANTLTTNGRYYVASGTNVPYTYIVLDVIHPENANDVIQIGYPISRAEVYRRRYNGTTWDNWLKITFS